MFHIEKQRFGRISQINFFDDNIEQSFEMKAESYSPNHSTSYSIKR